jgi:hypothetical protein
MLFGQFFSFIQEIRISLDAIKKIISSLKTYVW